MWEYVLSMYNSYIPSQFFECFFSLLSISVLVTFLFKGLKKGIRIYGIIILVSYLFLLYASTLFFRNYEKHHGYFLKPFWSYSRNDMLLENLMNVIVFVPIGLLVGCTIKKMSWKKVLFIGMGISLSIELLQLVFKRGYAEMDDLIHNTLGCMIGFGVYSLAKVGYERISKNHGST